MMLDVPGCDRRRGRGTASTLTRSSLEASSSIMDAAAQLGIRQQKTELSVRKFFEVHKCDENLLGFLRLVSGNRALIARHVRLSMGSLAMTPYVTRVNHPPPALSEASTITASMRLDSSFVLDENLRRSVFARLNFDGSGLTPHPDSGRGNFAKNFSCNTTLHGACVSREKALGSTYLAPFWDDTLQRMAPFPSLRLSELATAADAGQFTTAELLERDLLRIA
eukprot:SAG31_NODE_16748_length_697_cov_1.767559_1_plen_222_part_10